MEKEPRRFKISGTLEKLVKENMVKRLNWLASCNEISKKYNFEEYYHTTADYFSGGRLTGFASPKFDVNFSIFKKPVGGVYRPRAREGKFIHEEMDNIKDWSLKPIWDYLDYSPNPFGANGGYYQDNKLDDELLFFSYDTEFKGHTDLQELKKSEYFALIGE